MRLRFSVVASSLVLALFAACGGGDDGGSAGDDGGGDDGGGNDAGQDMMYVPPEANCTPLDLGAAPEVPIVIGAVTINPLAGAVTADTYTLTSVKLDTFLQVEGTAQARIEIVVGNATSGAARLAVSLQGEALGEMIDEQIAEAGLYTLSGTSLTVADGCGTGGDPLPDITYTATATTLTLWTEYESPIGGIPLELVFGLE